MSTNELREAYQRFFEERGHTRIPSAPLVPENDPTTLFVGSGMQPLVPYLLGQAHPQGAKLVNSQKSFRAEDIEEVGDNRHTTFFEMLGNWSLGDYFKEEQLPWIFEFLTSVVGLNPKRLYVTVFAGDEANGLPRDTVSAELWQQIFSDKGIDASIVDIGSIEQAGDAGMQNGRIFYYNAAKNWWSRAGLPENMPAGEPGGPDSEIFYDFGTPHDPKFGKQCHPNCDCGRFMEIGNSVFMEYVKQADGSFAPLPRKNVDFGGGLERLAAAVQDNADVFTIDAFAPIIRQLEEVSSASYTASPHQASFRIVADHVRGAVIMMADGVSPSNTERGYIVRRLLRRAIRHLDVLGIPAGSLPLLARSIVEYYRTAYPEVGQREGSIVEALAHEETKFRRTLSAGLREFQKIASRHISGADAFHLFASYGFPLEMTVDLAKDKGVAVDTEAFERAMAEHRAASRGGQDKKFRGGLADHSDMSIKYHTATHLLHQALQDILGKQAIQKGSNITPDRLRFDVAHTEKMTPEQLQKVTDIVNEKIAANLPVRQEEMTVEEAKAAGAAGLFSERYGERVRVYRIGDYSIEICGGPHVERTGALGRFSIQKEESAGAGVRRIRAVLQ